MTNYRAVKKAPKGDQSEKTLKGHSPLSAETVESRISSDCLLSEQVLVRNLLAKGYPTHLLDVLGSQFAARNPTGSLANYLGKSLRCRRKKLSEYPSARRLGLQARLSEKSKYSKPLGA